MEELVRTLLTTSHGVLAYALIFGVLVACGLGVPLPEDISLITGGYLAHQGAVLLPVMMGVGFVGILVGDSFIYLAGRRIGTKVGQHGFFHRLVTPEKRARVEGLFHKHGEKIVMIARFLPGVRAVTYFSAGSARMKYWKFILWDGLAALLSAPLFVYLGFRFGDEFDFIARKLRQGEYALAAAILVGIVALILFRRRRAAAHRAAEMQSEAESVSSRPSNLRAAEPVE